MVYGVNRSSDGSTFTTRSGTEDNCDTGAGSARAGTGRVKYRDGDTGRAVSESGRGEIIVGNGETCNSSSSKPVSESSDVTAANTGGGCPLLNRTLGHRSFLRRGSSQTGRCSRANHKRTSEVSQLNRDLQNTWTAVVDHSSCQLPDSLIRCHR